MPEKPSEELIPVIAPSRCERSIGVLLNQQKPSELSRMETLKEFCVRIQHAIVNHWEPPTSLRDALRAAAVTERWMEMRFGGVWRAHWLTALPPNPPDWTPHRRWAGLLPWMMLSEMSTALILKGMHSWRDGENLIHAGLALSGDRLPHAVQEHWLSLESPDQEGVGRLLAAVNSAPSLTGQPALQTRSRRMADVLFLVYHGGTESEAQDGLKGCSKATDRMLALLELMDSVEERPAPGTQSVILDALAKSFIAATRTIKKDRTQGHQWFSDICEYFLDWTPKTSDDDAITWLMDRSDVILCVAALKQEKAWWGPDHPWSVGLDPTMCAWVSDRLSDPRPAAALRKTIKKNPEILQIPVFQVITQRNALERASSPKTGRQARRAL